METRFLEHPCAQALSPFVHTYWAGTFLPSDGGVMQQEVLPNGFVELIFHVGDHHCRLWQGRGWSSSSRLALIGMCTSPYTVQFEEKVETFGVRIKPEGFFDLFGIPASEFKDCQLGFFEVYGAEMEALADRMQAAPTLPALAALADSFLMECIRRHHTHTYYLHRAATFIRASGGCEPLHHIMDRAGISPRQLERAFRQQMGVSPKLYQRIVRMNALNARMAAQHSLTQLAYEGGFSDQAHMNREFRQFAGLTPRQFLKAPHRYIVNF
jgi:AraC-like DNA-binding protein